MRLNHRLILALDVTDPKRAVELAGRVRPHVDGVKVGWPLVLAGGLDVLRTLSKTDYVLCDFKIADIPNTNRLIVEQAVDAGASGIICHGFVGEDSVRACVDAARGADVFVLVEMSHPGGLEYSAKYAEDLARVAARVNAAGIIAPATRPERGRALRAIIGRKQILMDPSVRLGPYRYDLPPHPIERLRQKELWQGIRDAAKRADVLTVSHYHYDHHNPAAPSIFRGKLAFLKDGKFHINRSQRERSGAFVRKLKAYPKAIQVADGNQMDFGGTELLFSPAVPHGYNDELGYVVMTRIADGRDVSVLTAAEFLGKPTDQLEANRDRLYGIEAPSPKGISGPGPSEG